MVIGDYDTVRKTLDRAVQGSVFESSLFIDTKGGRIVVDSRTRSKGTPPAWLVRWAERELYDVNRNITVGGRDYGVLRLKFDARSVASDLWGLSVLAVGAAFALLFLLANYLGWPQRAQSALFALFIAGLTLAAAWETWRGFRHDGLRSRHIAAGALACIAATRLIRIGLIVVQSLGVVPPATAAQVQSYTLYANVLFLLVATAGLVLMAQERVDRGAEPRHS